MMKSLFPKTMLLILASISICNTQIYSQCFEFYGMTPDGGEYNAGTIFRTDDNGDNFEIVYSFFRYGESALRSESQLCQANNGKLYGTLGNSCGIIFEWDPISNIYIKKFEFDGEVNGYAPVSVISTKNEKLYGITSNGGKRDAGVLFEWDPVNNFFIKKYDFDPETNGGYPRNPLIQADNGKLYGTTSDGGIYSCGVLFEWDPITDTYTKKLDFNGKDYGKHPSSPLIQADNGKLYGTTAYGGLNNKGVLFEYNIASNTYTKLFDFVDKHGEYPSGPLVQACDGKIYGKTNEGGIYGHYKSEVGWITDGVLFEWDTVSRKMTKKFDFNKREPTMYPTSLIQLGNDKLYGVTDGGDENHSLLVEWDVTNSSYSVIKEIVGSKNGRFGTIMLANNGKFYGIGSGGIAENGVLYEWDSSTNIYTKKIDLMWAENGGYPIGSLVQAENGKTYGTTSQGGVNNSGVIFEWDPVTATYIKKMDFNGTENGSYPYGSFLEAENGKLYGMTHQGGINKCGVIFEWDLVNNIYVKKYDFEKANGSMPSGNLIKANNGKFYGVTPYGGVFGCEGGGSGYGVLFEWDPINNIYSKKFDFNDTENGKNPIGSLVMANNGKLYGVTNSGGAYNHGVLFEWDPDLNIFTKKLAFNPTENGGGPQGSLILADNGKLYGTACCGVLFEWDPTTDTYTKKLELDIYHLGNTTGSLMMGHNGKFYGTTFYYGGQYAGCLFEWDPLTNICTKKKEFGINERPRGRLIEILSYPSSTIYAEACKSYSSPSGKYTWTSSGEYKDTIPSFKGCDSIITVNLTILNSATSTLNPTACNCYTSPGGKIWTASGEYLDTIPNYTGCDSVITIHLTINNSTTNTISPIVCGSYTSPSGKVWANSGVYTDTIPNKVECDSIITVNLTVKNSTTNAINSMACKKYISPGGKVWSGSGEYKDTIPNAAGCDSIITVNLTIMLVDTSLIQNQSVLKANASEATYQWIDCTNGNSPLEGETQQTFTAKTSGNYAVVISQNGCTDTSAVYTVIMTNLVTNSFKNNISIYPNPHNGSFTIDLGSVYPSIEIAISELDGHIIQKEQRYNSRIIEMKTSALPGMYMIRITSEDERAVFKVMKK